MRKVTAPDGREWKVGRQWFPRRPRLRDNSIDLPDGLGDFGFDDLGAIGLLLLAVAVLFVLLFFVFPIVVLAIEVLLLVLLFIAGLFARLVLRKPWHVLARTGEAAYRWPVKGWRASGRRRDEIAAELAAGSMPSGGELLER